MTRVDPITTQVIAKYLQGVAEEMSATLIRTAFSPNIKERADCSTAIFDASGRVIAQAHRIPIHLGSMLGAIEELLRQHRDDPPGPGDMFIANDPYSGGGSHLPDINVIAPVFSGDRIVAYVACIAHHTDVGGMVPGSESSVCTSIFQEGLRIPLVRIKRSGELNRDVLDIILLNSRTPDERYGDLQGQFAATTVGIRRIEELYDRYGDLVQDAMGSYLGFTADRFRAAIGRLPSGTYTAADFLDPQGDGEPLPIRLTLTVEEKRMRFDFTGSAPCMPSGRNVPRRALLAVVYTVAKTLLDPGIPDNAGYFETMEVYAPPGCFLNPTSGSAVGTRALTGAVVGDVVAAAISAALPQKALAGSGPHAQILFAGTDARTGSYFVNYETFAGGMGARPNRAGFDAVRVHASGASNLPVEALEHAYPLRVEQYAMWDGSGGDGLHRGGTGVVRDYRVLCSDVVLSLSSERQRVAARGMEGGGNGAKGRFILNPGTPTERELPPAVAELPMPVGSVLRVLTPGGGGFGPLEGKGEADA